MFLKDIIDKKIAINCRTEEEARTLFEHIKKRLDDNSNFENYINNINLWRTFKENTCYNFIYEKESYKIDFEMGPKRYYDEKHYKIITLDDLEDFKDFKKEVFIIKFPKFIDKILCSGKFAFNKTKKKLYLKFLDKEIRVKCDKQDKFYWKIGLGLALYRVYQKENDVKYMKKNYNYKKLAEYCLYKFYNFNENGIKDLEERVNNSKENTLIKL